MTFSSVARSKCSWTVLGSVSSHREAPEIDGIVGIPDHLPAGTFATLTVTGSLGPDLEAS